MTRVFRNFGYFQQMKLKTQNLIMPCKAFFTPQNWQSKSKIGQRVKGVNKEESKENR